MAIEVKDVVDDLLGKTMNGDLIWSLNEVESFRSELEKSAEAIRSKPRKSLGRRRLRKRAKWLRRRLRILNHETASKFHVDTLIEEEDDWGYGSKKHRLYRVIISISKEYTEMDIYPVYTKKYDYSAPHTARYSASSVDFPSLNMFPFILRNPDTTLFHEESKYAEDNL